MDAKAKKWTFLVLATALGLWGMSLQKAIVDTGLDSSGLLIAENPRLWLVWIVTAAYLAAVAVLTRSLGAKGSYGENFPACFFSGTASAMAGVLMAFSGLNGLVPGQMLTALCALVSGCAMALCGICRLSGRKPVWLLDFLVFCGYTLYLVLNYRQWSVISQTQLFAFRLLACSALILFSLHRAQCAVDVMDRRRMVFFGFAGLYLCLLAMPGAEFPGFYFASYVWCAGGMCELQRLDPPAPDVPFSTEPLPDGQQPQ